MQLGSSFGDRLTCDLDTFFDRVRVRTFLPRTFVKPTELAIRDADVRVIEVAIDVVISRQSMLLAAYMVGEFADCVEIGGVIKSQAFVKREALAIFYFERDFAEVWIE